MPYLQIGEKEYTPKTNFKFEKLANEKYNEETGGEKIGGFMSVYFKLLQYDNEGLLGFWDCALHHYKNEKPSMDAIEDALAEKIEEDADKAFSEAFKVLDESGFFKKKVKTIWTEFSKAPQKKEDETPEQTEKREQAEEMSKMMQKRRKELTGKKS